MHEGEKPRAVLPLSRCNAQRLLQPRVANDPRLHDQKPKVRISSQLVCAPTHTCPLKLQRALPQSHFHPTRRDGEFVQGASGQRSFDLTQNKTMHRKHEGSSTAQHFSPLFRDVAGTYPQRWQRLLRQVLRHSKNTQPTWPTNRQAPPPTLCGLEELYSIEALAHNAP